jgi:hypothetical protein
MKRLWTLTAATLAILLLLSTPTLTSAFLTNAAMLALRKGLVARDFEASQTSAGMEDSVEKLAGRSTGTSL